MSYTLPTFVKLTGAEALREHLSARNIDLPEDFDWSLPEAMLANAFKETFGKLGAEQQRLLERDFSRAEQFAHDDLQSSLRWRCSHEESALISELDRCENHRARALSILRIAPTVFEKAEVDLEVQFLYLDRRIWAGYQLNCDINANLAERNLTAFNAALKDIISRKFGADRSIELDFEARGSVGQLIDGGENCYQLTIFHEGDVDRKLVFDEDGTLGPRVSRIALMAALAYDPNGRLLEVAIRGGKQMRESIAQAFAEHMVAPELELTPLTPARFALQRLKRPHQLYVETESGVHSASLVSLNMKAQASDKLDTVLSVPGKPKQQSKTIWEMAKAQFGPLGGPLGDPDMQVVSATIRFAFKPAENETKVKYRQVKLSLSNGSNTLKFPEREKRLISSYLDKWGLRVDNRLPDTLAAE